MGISSADNIPCSHTVTCQINNWLTHVPESGSPQFYHIAEDNQIPLGIFMYVQCRFSGTSSQIIFSCLLIFCFDLLHHLIRDVNEMLRSETETFGFQTEMRTRLFHSIFPRSRPRCLILKPWQDWDWDIDRPRPRYFSRPWHVELHVNYLTVFCLT